MRAGRPVNIISHPDAGVGHRLLVVSASSPRWRERRGPWWGATGPGAGSRRHSRASSMRARASGESSAVTRLLTLTSPQFLTSWTSRHFSGTAFLRPKMHAVTCRVRLRPSQRLTIAPPTNERGGPCGLLGRRQTLDVQLPSRRVSPDLCRGSAERPPFFASLDNDLTVLRLVR